MGFVDVCLEKKEGIFGGEADAWCLPNGSIGVRVRGRWSRFLLAD